MHNKFFAAIERGDLQKVQAIINDSIMSHYDKITNDVGANSVIVASQNGHLELVKYFIGRGVPIDVPDDDGVTALQWACYNGYTDIAKFLIQNGADVDNYDYNNTTPLMDAAKGNHSEIIKLLLDKNAKIDIIDKQFNTALDHATHYGNQYYNDSVELLRQAENIKNNESWKNKRFSLFLTEDLNINTAKFQILNNKWIRNLSKKNDNFTSDEEVFYNECHHYERALLIIGNFYELGLNPAEANNNYGNKDKAKEHIQDLQKAYSDSLIDLGANPDLSFDEQMKEINDRYNKKYNMFLYNDINHKAETLLKASLCEALGYVTNEANKFDFDKIDEIINANKNYQTLKTNNENIHTRKKR